MLKQDVKLGEACLTLKDWLKRKIEPRDHLLGELFSTTSRVLFYADTGVGKTLLALAWAFAMAFGRNFLHWRSRDKARVLYIDGEMPRDLCQERLQLMYEIFDIRPEEKGDLFILSREDFEDMEPLDTEEGQRWLDDFIACNGPLHFIIFDNTMSLCSAIMREEESWQALKPYALGLTKRDMGQLWIHHTGHDRTRSYGTKTREWQMDIVIAAEQLSTDHININLRFKKCRVSKPSNYRNFEDVHIELINGEWVSHGEPEEKSTGRPNLSAEIALQALDQAIGDGDDASEEAWRAHAIALRISKSSDKKSQSRAFTRARDQVILADLVKPTKKGRFRRC